MSDKLIGGRYEIQARLGRGGMGTVYQAVDRRLMREVALKVMAAEAEPGDDQSFLFQREARAAAALQHPSIVQLFDYSGPEERPAFIVMELVRGDNLHALLPKRSPFPETMALGILQQVASALAHAHQHGVIHRDIKPGNILVETSGRVALTDFGLAKAYRNPEGLGRTLAGRKTEMLGTPGYMAPEQIMDEQSGPESDVFALGCVAYATATGASPFAHENTVECMRRIAEVDFRPLAELRPDFDGELLDLVNACLAKDVLDRPDAVDVASGAARLLQTLGCPEARECVRAGVAGETIVMLTRPAAKANQPIAEDVEHTRRWDETKVDGAVAGDQTTRVDAAASAALTRERREAAGAPTEVATSRRSSLLWIVGVVAVLVAVAIAGFVIGVGPEDRDPVAAASLPRPKADAGTTSAAKVAGNPTPVPAVTPPPASDAPPPPPAVAAPTPPQVAPPSSAPQAEAAASPPPADNRASPVRAADDGGGRRGRHAARAEPVDVQIVVKPWGTVFLDGQEVGNFPVIRVVSAPPGKHELAVVHPKRGRLKRTVVFGKERQAVFDFDEE